MSAHGTVRLIWSHGEDEFCLAKTGSILDLEDRCGAGFGGIMQRLDAGTWRLNDVREPIRLGLIGGGMAPKDAQAVLERHVDVRPLSESVLVAYEIMKAVLLPVAGEQPGKNEANQETPARPSSAMMEGSPGSPSTPQAPVSDGHPDKPTTPPSGKSPPASTATTSRKAGRRRLSRRPRRNLKK